MATANLTQRACRLELFTVGWNVIEAIVGIGAGVVAGSPSLMGFDLDSVVESTVTHRTGLECMAHLVVGGSDWLVVFELPDCLGGPSHD